MAKFERQLNSAYDTEILKFMTPAQQAEYKALRLLFLEYEDALAAADAEYRDAVAPLGLSPTPPSTYQLGRADSLVYALPSLSDEEKTALGEMLRTVRTGQRQALSDALTAAGVQRPTRGNREGWREYAEARTRVTREMEEKNRKETLESMADILSPENMDAQDVLTAAAGVLAKKRKDAEAQLTDAIEELIGPDRAKENTTLPSFLRSFR